MLNEFDKAQRVDMTAQGYWESAKQLYNTMKSLDPKAIASIASSTGGGVGQVLPDLFEAGKTISFLGPIVIISIQFYRTWKSKFDQIKDLQVLADRVEKTILWLNDMKESLAKSAKLSLVPMSQRSIPPKFSSMIEDYLLRLVDIIQDSRVVLTTDNDRSEIMKSISAKFDTKLKSLTKAFDEIHKEINFQTLPMILAMQEENQKRSDTKKESVDGTLNSLKDKLQQISEDAVLNDLRIAFSSVHNFANDYEVHLKRFFPGSRSWMKNVSCTYPKDCIL